MKEKARKDRYSDAPPDIAEALSEATEIVDRFPPPEDLRRQLKKVMTIRIDPDVYAWFKGLGRGYQTRINGVLRAYMTAKSTGTSSRKAACRD